MQVLWRMCVWMHEKKTNNKLATTSNLWHLFEFIEVKQIEKIVVFSFCYIDIYPMILIRGGSKKNWKYHILGNLQFFLGEKRYSRGKLSLALRFANCTNVYDKKHSIHYASKIICGWKDIFIFNTFKTHKDKFTFAREHINIFIWVCGQTVLCRVVGYRCNKYQAKIHTGFSYTYTTSVRVECTITYRAVGTTCKYTRSATHIQTHTYSRGQSHDKWKVCGENV